MEITITSSFYCLKNRKRNRPKNVQKKSHHFTHNESLGVNCHTIYQGHYRFGKVRYLTIIRNMLLLVDCTDSFEVFSFPCRHVKPL